MTKKVGNISIKNANILFRNFSGNETKFNPEGKRNFCVTLDPELALDLKEDGWNVRYLQPREEGDEPTPYLQVSLSFNIYPPTIWLINSTGKTPMNEGNINMLDWTEFDNVDLVLRPYSYEIPGRTGIKAYVKSAYFTIVENEFDAKYADLPVK